MDEGIFGRRQPALVSSLSAATTSKQSGIRSLLNQPQPPVDDTVGFSETKSSSLSWFGLSHVTVAWRMTLLATLALPLLHAWFYL